MRAVVEALFKRNEGKKRRKGKKERMGLKKKQIGSPYLIAVVKRPFQKAFNAVSAGKIAGHNVGAQQSVEHRTSHRHAFAE